MTSKASECEDSLNSMKLKYSDSVSGDLPAAQPLAHCFCMALFLEIDWLHNVTQVCIVSR